MKTRRLILKGLKNKYLLSLLIFTVWMLFFDQNNLIGRFSAYRDIRQFERDKEYLQKRINEDSARIKELITDKDNLEKFAREQYLMKRDNEEIFIIEFDD